MATAPSPETRPAGAVAPNPIEPRSIASGSWPRTRLTNAACLLAVIAAAVPPIALARPTVAQVVLIAPVLVLAAFAARWSFDSPTLRRRGRLTPAVAVRTLPAAVAALLPLTATAAVDGLRWSPVGWAAAGVLVPLSLCFTAAARAVEVRWLRISRRMFVISSVSQRDDIEREARQREVMHIVGFVDAGHLADGSVDGAALQKQVDDLRATVVIVAGEAARNEAVCSAVARVHRGGVRIRDMADFYEGHFKKVPLSELTPSWFLFDVAELHRPRLYGRLKRVWECLLAASCALMLAPVLACAALAILVSTGRPVLYRQQRVGRYGSPFTMYKLRTMRPLIGDADAAWASDVSSRITPVGRLLRRTRIDELPQLVNVMLGHLSLVGPRPEQVPIVERMYKQVRFYDLRHVVRPGLTGWAQVNMGYGGSQSGTLAKLQYDFFYVRHQSLRLDLLILLLTVRAVARGPDR